MFFSLLVMVAVCSFTQILSAETYSQIEQEIPPGSITAAASSTWPSSEISPAFTVNRYGLSVWLHSNGTSAQGMWHTYLVGGQTTHPGTIPGAAWIKYSFDNVYDLGQMWVWNHNQLYLLDRGLKKVYIQYSTDNSTWHTLMNGGDNFFYLSKASGGENIFRTDAIDFNGAQARYVVITADSINGNYGGSEYGLSEVRFGIDGTSDLLSPCPEADFNGDCIVNTQDLILLIQNWLSVSEYDLDGVAPINFIDFAILADNWQSNRRAEALTEYIQEWFWDPAESLYKLKFPANPSGSFAWMWDHGIQLTVLTGAGQYYPETYTSIFAAYYEALNHHYWDDSRSPAGYQPGYSSSGSWGGDDRYYDDNAWVGMDYAYAYDVFGDAAYLQKAKDIYEFLETGWDSGDTFQIHQGGYWHVSRDTDSSKAQKGTIANATTAFAGLLLAQRTTGPESESYLTSASNFMDWAKTNLRDTDVIYMDHWNVYQHNNPPQAYLVDWKFTYTSGMMIRCHLLRHQLYSLLPAYDELSDWVDACDESEAADSYFLVSGRYKDAAFFSHHLAESLLLMYDETGETDYLDHSNNTSDYYWNMMLNNSIYTNYELKDFSGMTRLFWLLKGYK